MTPKSVFYISLALLLASLLGTSTLCEDEVVVFEPYSVKVWDTGFLFRESVISLHTEDRTGDFNQSWKFLMMRILIFFVFFQLPSFAHNYGRNTIKPANISG